MTGTRRGFFDGSAEGYEKGLSDGLAGRPKKPVATVAELAAHAVRPKSYTESFVKGYSRGHAEGLRQRNQPPKPAESFYQERFFKDQCFKNRRGGVGKGRDRASPDVPERDRER